MRRALALAALLAIASAAQAKQAPQGDPATDAVVRDAEFGVVARHFGLERRVEMLQWQAVRGRYTQVWSEAPIDSSGFAPAHANPGTFPLRSRRWIAAPITLDGKPLAPQAVERLGEWRSFRPNFSALPGNLAATFQPEGDGLGSAENPLDPQVGDLRIHWREMRLPSLADKVVLRNGRWQLPTAAQAAASIPSATATSTATRPAEPGRAPWLLGGGVLVLLVGLMLARRRHRR